MLSRLASHLKELLAREEPGQGMIEYTLIIALVAVVAIAGLIVLGPSIANLVSSITATI